MFVLLWLIRILFPNSEGQNIYNLYCYELKIHLKKPANKQCKYFGRSCMDYSDAYSYFLQASEIFPSTIICSNCITAF